MRDKRRAVLEKLLQVATGANTEWSVTQGRIDQALAELDALEVSEADLLEIMGSFNGSGYVTSYDRKMAKYIVAALKKKRGEKDVA